jgi:hypothetical protein
MSETPKTEDETRESPLQIVAWMGGAVALVAGAIAFLA